MWFLLFACGAEPEPEPPADTGPDLAFLAEPVDGEACEVDRDDPKDLAIFLSDPDGGARLALAVPIDLWRIEREQTFAAEIPANTFGLVETWDGAAPGDCSERARVFDWPLSSSETWEVESAVVTLVIRALETDMTPWTHEIDLTLDDTVIDGESLDDSEWTGILATNDPPE